MSLESAMYIANWINDMQDKYQVSINVEGNNYDWGQALCHHQYGSDPTNWADDPTEEDIKVANDWLKNGCPYLRTPKGETP